MGYSMDLTHVKSHYAEKQSLGPCPQGVDWKDDAAQIDRLNALRLLMGNDTGYTLNDWGCGYGMLARLIYKECARYHGYDILPQKLNIGDFHLSDTPTVIADYTVASGLFNVMTGGNEEWAYYVLACLKTMNAMSRKGFAFNCLSDRANRRDEGLYYANAYGMTRICMEYGRVSLLQYYSPWDFTIICQKE
mgnify:CR=1 FL=1